MKICVFGNDTLAAAVAECCRRFFSSVVHAAMPADVPDDADVVWLCDDTPIGPDNVPDVPFVVGRAIEAIGRASVSATVILSSQVPIGTTYMLEYYCTTVAYVPENIRVKTAVEDFLQQSRIVIGMRRSNQTWQHEQRIQRLLEPFTSLQIWTTPETAEMAKHALNAYLGLSIAFINEIARIGIAHGVVMADVERALLTERRISPAAPLKSGPAFGGGHLARDIHVLSEMASRSGVRAPIIEHILGSNSLVP